MAILLQSFVLLSIFAVLSTGIYIDGYGQNTNQNFADKSWEHIFQSSQRSSVLPLYRYMNKLYYMGIHFRARWVVALNFCESLHMKLLTIHSEDENERVHKYIRDASKGHEYWIGGTRLVDGYKWIWMPYGTQVEYTNWSNGQPSDVNEKCMQVWITNNKLTWNDRDCNAEFFFVCERYVDSSTSGPPGL
ncbi:unnamed protein product [Psylliodes chrysocephalus]|uniref:C-type lectin domain-containing protein n=1 Tax=Psylliodes chrysocephalus TaxID=3402493 RepID=A0A9P0CGR9_9CUCU|nr:unnamed protein product [Psylliodes chrysocephala]